MARKRQIETQTDALTVPGPPPGSKLKYLLYSFALITNLYLAVFCTGARVFYFRMTLNKKTYFTKIGALGVISFDEVFQKARQCRDMVKNGLDPRQAFKAAHAIIFKDFVEHKFWPYALENYKTHQNVRNMLDNRILPTFGSMPLKKSITRWSEVFNSRYVKRPIGELETRSAGLQ